MADELFANGFVAAVLVGHEPATTVRVRNEDRAQRFASDVGNVEGTDVAAALDERDDGLLAHQRAATLILEALLLLGVAVLRLAADIGFVGFDRFAVTAHGAGIGIFHGLADAMHHE